MSIIGGQFAFRAFRAWGWPEALPLNYTFSLTSRCNYRCATCRVHDRAGPEMSADDYRKLFASLGKSPFWATFSGGEPFLRRDLESIVGMFCRMCRPRLVNIPTNGSQPGTIGDVARNLAERHAEVGFIVNVSIDAVGDRQDELRGSPGAWANSIATVKALAKDRPANLTVGIGAVVSKLNLGSFPGDWRALASLGAGSMVAEPAEIRKELANQGLDIAPDADEFRPIADMLVRDIDSRRKAGWPGLAQAFRRRYYDQLTEVLGGRKVMPCYAGFASAHVMPDGEVWGCCIKGDLMGRLEEHSYDFVRLWRSRQAREARKAIKARGCSCPLANAAYTNMTFDIRSALSVMTHFIR